jgi:hypothetical protein
MSVKIFIVLAISIVFASDLALLAKETQDGQMKIQVGIFDGFFGF